MFQDFYWRVTQSHNGYIETYIDGGIVGLGMLACFLISGARLTKRALMEGSDFGRFRFILLLIAMIYNFTEATYLRLAPVWMMQLVVCLYVPVRSREPSLRRELIPA
jgi:O-antigen ligase